MPAATDNKAATNRSKGPTLRVFFALWPDTAARELIAAMTRDVVERAGGRAARSESVHLTLAFVGDVAQNRIAALERIGEFAARGVAPFTLALDRLGGFRDAGVLWLGADAMPSELQDLVRALNEGLEADGFPVEQRPYRAHVTLARRCGSLSAATMHPVAWRVEHITLTASELRPAGSRYRELATWPLSRAG